jgi:hypothetical protein
MDGMTAVCPRCGHVYFAAQGHACTARALVPAASLPDGTPHPDSFLAERGWMARGGVFVRATGGGGGEEAAA